MDTGNTYCFVRDEIWRRFGDTLAGPHAATFLVATSQHIDGKSREALEKSAEALGWGTEATFVWTDTDHALDAVAFFEVLEGLDPLCVVLASEDACHLAQDAYRQDIVANTRFRLFGREACAVPDLAKLVQDEHGKQRVWGLLKTFPCAPQ